MPATTPKIEELRFKLKTDPKSRLFYPLGEELRKIGNLEEAEQVLRAGLEYHPSYLSGWVGLGRVLRERSDNAKAAEVLSKALQLDPGNVVAARLLAETYLDMGEKVEAIKKFKLVSALLGADEEIEATIQKIEQELAPTPPTALPAVSDEESAGLAGELGSAAQVSPSEGAMPAVESPAPAEPQSTSMVGVPEEPAPEAVVLPEAAGAAVQGLPVESPFAAAAPEASPFGDAATASGAVGEAFALPLAAEVAAGTPWGEETAQAPSSGVPAAESAGQEAPSPWGGAEDSPFAAQSTDADDTAPGFAQAALPPAEPADIFAASAEPLEGESGVRERFAAHEEAPIQQSPGEVVTDTVTMAELYARQGLIEDARKVYLRILAREPDHAEARSGLDSLTAGGEPAQAEEAGMSAAARRQKASRLEQWLAKVKREGGRV